MTMESSLVTILLDIKEQNGAMGAQMHEAARTRERLEERLREVSQKLDMVDHRTDTIEARQTDVVDGIAAINTDITSNIKPDVAKLKLLAGKFTAFWGAGIAVILWGVSYFSNEIHALVASMFGRHP